MEKLKNHWQSKSFRLIVCFLAVVILMLISFRMGRFVGFRQAGFLGRLGDNYHQAFEGGPRGGLMAPPIGFWGDNLPGGNGAVGKIVKIALPNLVVAGPDNTEKTIVLNEQTIIRQFRETLASTSLKVGDFAVILGEPNAEAQIEAKLIRLK